MSIHVEIAGNRICYQNNKPKRVAKQDFARAEERRLAVSDHPANRD